LCNAEKRAEYGPIGNGGNGLVLHSALAVNADNGQPMGLLWEKLWHREHQEAKRLTKQQKKKKQAEARKRPLESKESYKQVLLGFLTNIAAQLLEMTYLNRTNPEAPASEVLNQVQIEVLVAKSRKPVTAVDLTVAWAMSAVASLGGYLSHRRKSNIGITGLWRGFLELQSLCEGWLLHKEA
jgi:hypothetical protein